jgi:hypothetical protein
MPAPTGLNNLENRKFRASSDDDVAVAVNLEKGFKIPVFDFDKTVVTYPDDITEVYTFTLAAATVQVVTVKYLTDHKTDLDEVTWA